MSTSTQHSQRPYHESNIRTSDVRGAKTLATYLAQHTQHGPPSHRGPTMSQDTARHYGAHPESSRNDSQSQDGYGHVDGSYRTHDTNSLASHHQPMVGISRRYHTNPNQPLEHADTQISQHTSHQRHPNLSLDTRNLPNSRPSPFTPSRPPPDSPALTASDSPTPLHADLTSLKSGLESLWNLSSKKLHILHSTITAHAESLRTLSITNANLESSMAQQQTAHSQEIERLGGENSRLIRDAREAEEGRVKALREREMLSEANARLWEDKARLEGEKRELRVKLDAETDFARLCQRELEKEKESQPAQKVKVKMEEDEDGRTRNGVTEIRVPLVHVEELIESRLRYQATEFTRATEELYQKLAHSQTRVTELEAQFKRYSAGTNTGGMVPPVPPHPPPHPNGRRIDNRPGKTSPIVTPVTPHTALPSSVSENGQEYPLVKGWNGKKIPEPTYRLSGVSVRHAEHRPAPPVGTREFHVNPRTASGSAESRSLERDICPRRVSVPVQSTRPASYSNSPIMDPLHIGKRVAPEPPPETRGQVVSTYTGVEAGWRPAPPPSARSSCSQRSASHSRPATPDRPSKRARTLDLQDTKTQEESSKAPTDAEVVSNTAEKPSVSSETTQPPEVPEQPGQEMSPDERLMFPSLSRVLVKKRDNDGWKCVLCRQEKKSPTAIFAETTPIGVVTDHVKCTHKQFWKDLQSGRESNVTSGS